MRITKALDGLPPKLRNQLEKAHFDRERLEALAQRVGKSGADANRVTGTVEPPRLDEVVPVPAAATAEGAAAIERGRAALARGEVAFVVLAGGMATRMGGVVKALVEVLPDLTFLGYRIREIDLLHQRYGARIPLWIMTSFATSAAIEQAIEPYREGRTIATFQQDISLRLTQGGDLFKTSEGGPSIYATGHGDLPDALKRSGLLDDFLARGGKTIWIANIDNLGATIDPMLLGWHLGHGAPLSVEVVDKVGTDKGGIPCRLDGRPVILEEFRLPKGFDAAKVRTFNTNTFIVDARALRDARLDWTWFEVKKQVDNGSGTMKDVVQFERLLGELTSALDTRFVKVPRDGLASRFLPVKDGPELDARRPEIASIARDRGVIA
ncbi:MAG: UTP--glucose-1-phosphate uridylyltransferase [Deltaproteobacteria bacterium]|nr:UTP--glucose-1-phosphate uridylyltransferase [Deltaproteobacteria bacterium]